MGTAENEQMPWMTLSYDPITTTVEVVGFDKTSEGLATHASRTEAAYIKSFDMNVDDLPLRIFAWLRDCGVPSSEAREVVNKIGETLQEEILEMLAEPAP